MPLPLDLLTRLYDEAVANGQTLTEFMDAHRGETSELGILVMRADVQWLRDIADILKHITAEDDTTNDDMAN